MEKGKNIHQQDERKIEKKLVALSGNCPNSQALMGFEINEKEERETQFLVV